MVSVKRTTMLSLPFLDSDNFEGSVGDSSLNLLGFGEAQQEIFILHGIRVFKESESLSSLVLVLPHVREFKHWQELIVSSFPELDVLKLPSTTYWSSEKFSNQFSNETDRLQAITQSVLVGDFKVVLATIAGLQQTTLSFNALKANGLTFCTGEELDLDDVVERLRGLGYAESELVNEPGTFSRRGGILDVYSYTRKRAVRIEFFTDIVESIREFDPDSQKSSKNIDSIQISFAQEADLSDSKEMAQCLYDKLLEFDGLDNYVRQGMVDAMLGGLKFPGIGMYYPIFRESMGYNSCYLGQLNGCSAIILLGSIERYKNELSKDMERYQAAYESDLSSGHPTLPLQKHFVENIQLENLSGQIEFGNPYAPGVKSLLCDVAVPKRSESDIENHISYVKSALASDRRVIITSHNSMQAERVKGVLSAHGISCEMSTKSLLDNLALFESGAVNIIRGYVSQSVGCESEGWLLIPEHAFFGEPKRRLSPKSTLKSALSSFKDLKVGGLVVHVEHGVGRYQGMKKISIANTNNEFLVLEYGGGDRVYLPVDKLNQLQKYSGGDGDRTSLDKLKGQAWQKKKSRVRSAVKDIADELLKLHAQRKMASGFAFSQPNDLYFQLEADFPHVETDDQLRCIEDVNADLSAPRPMDRLICGDVGFGKTEIAIRAAMRVVMDGFQVLVLAPTTVLSFQHWNTFVSRFKKYGVSVNLLNRFIKPKMAKDSVEKFNDGKIDILVGTHRVLGKSLKGRNIGLIIVDEEQRFGVSQKEKIKSLRSSCDILTLSATPIPRSLHMSLLGLRDISILMTPPTERLEVKTYVAKWEASLIKSSIEREIQRGGQVFFVHNRVSDILEIADFIRNILPDVKVQVAHGQMTEVNLEQVIVDFMDQKFSILLCTTIIESGIDMPNVNTIIVNNADRFGLSQLYQMRGRVGRSSRQSYAYFLTKSTSIITSDAEKRLEVLAAHQELGAGFQIANYDLEIRGAGDLLGGAQSGHVSDVGLELYTQLLEEEIRRTKGSDVSESVDPEIKLTVNATIPSDYIASQSLRLNIYKRIFTCSTHDGLEEISQELGDRFGALPRELVSLMQIGRLKLGLKSFGISLITKGGASKFELKFSSLSEEKIRVIQSVANNMSNIYSILPDYSMIIDVSSIEGGYNSELEALNYAVDVLSNMVDSK